MPRSEIDKFRLYISNAKRGYYTTAFVFDHMLDCLIKSPERLPDYLAASPTEFVEKLTQWVASFPADDAAWTSWMNSKLYDISSNGGEVTHNEKLQTRGLVEYVRQHIHHSPRTRDDTDSHGRPA